MPILPRPSKPWRLAFYRSGTIFAALTASSAVCVAGPANLTSASANQPIGAFAAASVADNQAPRVTLKLMNTGKRFDAPARVRLLADAEDSDGHLERVDFYAGQEKIGEASEWPYSMVWANVPAGTYKVFAAAYDEWGAQTSSRAVTVTVTEPANKPPTAQLVDPYPGAKFLGPATLQLTAEAVDADGQISKLEFFAGKTKLAEVASAPYAFTWNNVKPGKYSLWVKATDNKGASGKSKARVVQVKPTDKDLTAESAARFLLQSTYGPSLGDIEALRKEGIENWLNRQFHLPLTSHNDFVTAAETAGESINSNQFLESFWKQAATSDDQLRQRVAQALSQIFVVSGSSGPVAGNSYALAAYMDVLAKGAFGNFRDLLEAVTLNLTMGRFLDLRGSDGDPTKNKIPNENYPREILQLFSIGLVQLGLDGKPILDKQGHTIPTYGQTEVIGFSEAMSGFSFGEQDTNNFWAFFWWPNPLKNYTIPMRGWVSHHSPGEKRLLNGVVLPAGQKPEEDLSDALDVIFAHPNVGPFIGKQLIQRLVTSNPSPDYVARVAKVFNNNGNGVRGDLKAVVRAILLDKEARSPTEARKPTFGKVREPIVRLAHFIRAFNARAQSGKFSITGLDNPNALNQGPLQAPTVFNFYEPDFKPQGIIADSQLVSPEMQITTTSTVIATGNYFQGATANGINNNANKLVPDYTYWLTLASNPEQLIDQLSLCLAARTLSDETRETLISAINSLPSFDTQTRVTRAVQLMLSTPEFTVQK